MSPPTDFQTLGYTDKSRIRLAVFASGGGSNAQKIMEFFKSHPRIDVFVIVSNNPNAGVIGKAKSMGVPTHLHTDEDLTNGRLLHYLNEQGIDYIALAGYLRRISSSIVNHYAGRIVNIHPALLPKHGGKGMFGINVHRDVIKSGDKESGVTIHLVNDHYDKGVVLVQKRCPVLPGDTADKLAQRILSIEHAIFAPTLEKWILRKGRGLLT